MEMFQVSGFRVSGFWFQSYGLKASGTQVLKYPIGNP
jgi:hypothetical protein